MAVLRIAKMGNPILLQKAAPIPDPTALEIRRLAAEMQDTLEDIGASGLAREVMADRSGIDPLFIDLMERWPGRERWFGNVTTNDRP